MKNLKLRARIVELFGSQAVFAVHLRELESNISRVVNGYRQLDMEQKERWAKTLNCNVSDIFPS